MQEFKPWRPRRLEEFEGQSALKKEVAIEILACQTLNKAFPSTLLFGPPGLGKTTFAELIAHELDVPLFKLTGEGLTHETMTVTLIKDFHDLGLRAGYDTRGRLVDPYVATMPIVLIDECEKMSRGLMEICHPLLEPDNEEGVPIFQACFPDTGELFNAWVPRFTFVWLTNFAGDIADKSSATLSRFKLRKQFQWYNQEEAERVVLRQCQANGLTIEPQAVPLIAARSHGMPRQICTILERAVSHMIYQDVTALTVEVVNMLLEIMEIDAHGFDPQMREYLKCLVDAPAGRLSLQSLAGMLGSDTKTLSLLVEPVLMKDKLIIRSSSGRSITDAGRAIFGKPQDRFDVYRSVAR
jgi:holliday junction DNA helicase RuvB